MSNLNSLLEIRKSFLPCSAAFCVCSACPPKLNTDYWREPADQRRNLPGTGRKGWVSWGFPMALHGSSSGLGKGKTGRIFWDHTVQEETKIGQENKGWLLKGLGNDNPLNKGMGVSGGRGHWWREHRLQGGQNGWGNWVKKYERTGVSWAWVMTRDTWRRANILWRRGHGLRQISERKKESKLSCLSCHTSFSSFFLTGQQSAFNSSATTQRPKFNCLM